MAEALPHELIVCDAELMSSGRYGLRASERKRMEANLSKQTESIKIVSQIINSPQRYAAMISTVGLRTSGAEVSVLPDTGGAVASVPPGVASV